METFSYHDLIILAKSGDVDARETLLQVVEEQLEILGQDSSSLAQITGFITSLVVHLIDVKVPVAQKVKSKAKISISQIGNCVKDTAKSAVDNIITEKNGQIIFGKPLFEDFLKSKEVK